MISIVVPVYNSIGSLERCVDSLLAQTYTDLEVILVEDSSDDGSGKLCDELAEKHARVHSFHKKNEGVSSARNYGIERSSGEYVMFTDSDDYVEPEFAERLLAALGENDLALCGFHHHYRGRDIEKIPKTRALDEADIFLDLYGQGFMNMPWNKLFRRESLWRFDTSLSLGEDLLFNIDYLKRAGEKRKGPARMAVVSEPLCHYIQDDTGKSLSSKKRDDRYILARRIWRETGKFYREIAGEDDKSGIINARFVQDVLDDVEALPFDGEKSRKERLAVIEGYMSDADFRSAAADARIEALDYRVILFFMRRRMKRLTYLMCAARALLVRLGVHNG